MVWGWEGPEGQGRARRGGCEGRAQGSGGEGRGGELGEEGAAGGCRGEGGWCLGGRGRRMAQPGSGTRKMTVQDKGPLFHSPESSSRVCVGCSWDGVVGSARGPMAPCILRGPQAPFTHCPGGNQQLCGGHIQFRLGARATGAVGGGCSGRPGRAAPQGTWTWPHRTPTKFVLHAASPGRGWTRQLWRAGHHSPDRGGATRRSGPSVPVAYFKFYKTMQA